MEEEKSLEELSDLSQEEIFSRCTDLLRQTNAGIKSMTDRLKASLDRLEVLERAKYNNNETDTYTSRVVRETYDSDSNAYIS